MAKEKGAVASVMAKPKKKRPGVHAKTRTDSNKKSKHWVKPYKGQG